MDQRYKTSFRSSVEPILSFISSLKREARAHNKLDRRNGGLSADPSFNEKERGKHVDD